MRSHFLLACSLAGPALIRAQAVTLGSAAQFAVLGATTVTNTGPTILTGDLGVSPGTAITGFPPGIASGSTNSANDRAAAAQADALTAYNAARALPVTQDLTGQDLGGLTLRPGVYSFSSSAQLTGTLTLDAGGDPSAQFVFQIGSTITTASASMVMLINGAQPCSAIFQVGSSATLGTGTQFMGVILANTAITATTSVSNVGSLVALNAAVTLDTNTVSNCPPTTVATTSSTISPATAATISSTSTIVTVTTPTDSSSSSMTSAPPTTDSTPTSSTVQSTKISTSPTPTSTTICIVPGQPPVGGISPPRCGCNDIFSDWFKNPFKIYSRPSSSQSPSYPRKQLDKVCKAACDLQFKACQDIYAESCKGNVEGNGKDSFDSASKKCKKQGDECRKLNQKPDETNKCVRFGIKFRRSG